MSHETRAHFTITLFDYTTMNEKPQAIQQREQKSSENFNQTFHNTQFLLKLMSLI